MTTVVILQSNYLPWKGYFDLIQNADVCVFLDSVQYTKNDWRNRNRIIQRDGSIKWLSIPVGKKIHRRIDEVALPDSDWQGAHLSFIRHCYQNSPHVDLVIEILRLAYSHNFKFLSELNQFLIREIVYKFLDSPVEFRSDESVLRIGGDGGPTSRLIQILKACRATSYISGPMAKNYLDMELFENAGIEISFADYSDYPRYQQNCHNFVDSVSVVDAIAWNGLELRAVLKGGSLLGR